MGRVEEIKQIRKSLLDQINRLGEEIDKVKKEEVVKWTDALKNNLTLPPKRFNFILREINENFIDLNKQVNDLNEKRSALVRKRNSLELEFRKIKVENISEGGSVRDKVIEYQNTLQDGLKEMVVFNLMTAFRCGYVGVPKGHFLYGKEEEFEVHGGITWTGELTDGGDYWYFGFDCGHCDDNPDVEAFKNYSQGSHLELLELFSLRCWGDGEVRDHAYVREEVGSLTRQIRSRK